ncbi:hypothetical protein [Acrocarpospora sp. B8E8]|uniref:hypothetical protein n=1 Tax=Acrocarpospora sp. B8E8 TaxID=3153572 RepID=UPI00325CC255
MDPAGVQALIRRLEAGKSVLAGVRPGLEAAIAEAGADWAGSGGVTAMHRAWAFFHDAQVDLRWRLEVLQQVVPDGSPPLTTVRVPFTSQEEAVSAGRQAGRELADALAAHLADGTAQSWARVEAGLTAAGNADTRDPAYAAALLAALDGPEAVRTIFTKWLDAHTASRGRGLAIGELDTAQESLGPLAVAFAAAETSGRLPAGWREDVLANAGPATLSAMVALTRASDEFLNAVAVRQLGSPGAGYSASFPEPDWNSVLVAGAYIGNADALQQLLAENRQVAGQLLDPDLIRGTGTAHFSDLVAAVLDGALDPNTGSAATRERAWINLIDGVGYDGTQNASGHFASFENSPVNGVLAKHITPYLGQLARGQVHAYSRELGLAPSGLWKGLHEDVAARFIGALMQDPDTAKKLQADFEAYVQSLDIGQAHPYSSDKAERAVYTRLSAEAGGLSNLLLGGSAYAEFNDDEFIDMVADAALLPVNYTFARVFRKATPLGSTAVDYHSSGPKDLLADVLKDHLDELTPETAGVVADRLVSAEVDAVQASLAKHGQDPLTVEDREMLMQAFRGRLSPALVKALEIRGG